MTKNWTYNQAIWSHCWEAQILVQMFAAIWQRGHLLPSYGFKRERLFRLGNTGASDQLIFVCQPTKKSAAAAASQSASSAAPVASS